MIDLIELNSPDEATEWYIRGHVDESEAIAAVRDRLEGDVRDGYRDHVPALGAVRHLYARWGLGTNDDGDLTPGWFYTRAKPGRGAFKVTVVNESRHD